MTEKELELLKIGIQRGDWKHLKLWSWVNRYEAKAEEWNNLYPPVTDDRRVYINTYKQVYDAIDSLPDNPNNLVRVAMNRILCEECERMDKILKGFRFKKERSELAPRGGNRRGHSAR